MQLPLIKQSRQCLFFITTKQSATVSKTAWKTSVIVLVHFHRAGDHPKNLVVPGVVRKNSDEKGGSFCNIIDRTIYQIPPATPPLPNRKMNGSSVLFCSHLGHVFCSPCLTNGITPLSSLLNVKGFDFASQETSRAKMPATERIWKILEGSLMVTLSALCDMWHVLL